MAQWPWGGGGWGGGGGGGWGGGWGGGGGGWGGGGGGRRPEDNAGFWLREREMMQHQRIQRRPTYVHTKPQIRRALPSTGPGVADKAAPPIPDKAPAEAAFVIDVLGDSLGQLLAQGLQETYVDRPEITIVRKAKGDTGLVANEVYDWPKAVHDLLASNEKVNMAVMMIGSNDRQPIRDGNNRYEPLSDKWKEIYGNRVEEIAKAFREKRIPLLWVGLPISKSERLSSDYSEINEVVRERLAKQDAGFVDIWEAFGDSRGLYNAFGPDVNGVIVKLRAMDGVHFTKPGARKLAHFAESEVKRLFDLLKPKADPAVSTLEGLPTPLAPAEPATSTKMQGGSNTAPGADGQQAALPAQPLVPAPPPKPASGPILPLTTPPIAPGGDLARRARTRDSSGDAQALVDRAISRGQPLEPKPNRADNFTWPRAAQ